MIRPVPAAVFAACVATLTSAIPTFAQRPDTSAVPRALAEALLGSFGPYDTVGLLVGAIPPDAPDVVFLPPRSVVLGSLDRRGVLMVIIDVPDSLPAVLHAYREELARRVGERRVEAPSGGGFRPAEPRRTTLLFCGEDHNVMIVASPLGPNRTRVRLTVQGPSMSFCEMRQFARSDVPVPSLNVPPDAEWLPGGGGSTSEGYSRADVRLRTTRSTRDLVAYFGPQLTEAGWSAASALVDGLVAAQAWRRTDEDGAAWYLLVYALPFSGEPDQRLVAIQVTRVRNP